MSKKEDSRRVRTTKRLMKDALQELLEQEELTKITVTDICRQADVHRSTFYQYYAAPSDLLREIEQDFLDMIPSPSQLKNQKDQKQVIELTAAFFDFIRQNEKTFRLLFSERTGGRFTLRLAEILCSGYVPVELETDEPSGRFLRLYIVNGAIGILREWVYTGFPVSSRKLAEMMYSFSNEVIHAELPDGLAP